MKSTVQTRSETAAAKDLFLTGVFVSAVMVLAVSCDAFGEFIRWYSAHGKPRILGGGAVAIFLLPVALGMFSYRRWCEVRYEITERQRMEERQLKELEMRNVFLWLHEKASSLSDSELYNYVLERAVNLTESTIGFFHLVSDDQRNIILTAWNSETVKDCTASYATHYPIEQAGDWVDCVRYKRPVVYNDLPNFPNGKSLSEGHTPIKRFIGIPVLDGDKVRIIFCVGNKSKEYDDLDVLKIQMVTNCLQNIIKQRRSELVLRESEAKYRTLFESATDAIFLIREDRFIDCNPNALKMFACERDELIGNYPYVFSTPLQPDGKSSKEQAHERLAMSLSGIPQFFEWRHCRADGTPFDAEVILKRIDLPDNVLILGTVRDVTNRKRAEKELLRSQERLSMALESSRAGIWDRNVVEGASEWDDNHHLLFGLARGGYSGNPEDFFSMIHPDDRERVRMEMDAAINGNAKYSTTYRVIWPDSSEHFLADRGKVYCDGNGRAVRMLGISWDISDLKQVEEALTESQQQFKNIINFLPDATFVIDREGKVIAWNRAIEEMTGIRGGEILGKGNYEYALPFHGERMPILIDLVLEPQMEIEERYESFARDELMVTAEVSIPKLRGKGIHLWGMASLLRDSRGNVVGAIESMRDVTRRTQAEEELGRYRDHLEELVKERTDALARVNEQLMCEIEVRGKAEEALRESQQMLQLVLDTIPARVFWKNLDSVYLGCNRPFALDAGLRSPEDIIGKVDFEMGWVEQAESYRADDRLVMETGRPKLGYEEPLTTRDGGRIWLRTNKAPLLDADGNTKGVLGTYEDITENKRMEDALRENSQKLKHFAYSVAHDLKSPAIGVYGLTRRLARHSSHMLDEKGRSYCDQILKASEYIAELVDKINTYIMTKEVRLSIENVDISEVIQMLRDEFSSRLSIRGIDWLEPASRIAIRADRMCMVRAFRNFVDNSLKYGGEKLSRIWIGYEETQDFHIFSFSDDGKGLKEEGSEKIFEAFQRNESSNAVEGAGLGLTIVREIAEQHGGKVWVGPKSGKGVTFCISVSRNL